MPSVQRIILKLSGEILSGSHDMGIDLTMVDHVITEVVSVFRKGAKIGIVIGGGNFFRGVDAQNLSLGRVEGDYIGMMGTIMNGLALKSNLAKKNVPVKLISAIEIPKVCDSYQLDRVPMYYDQGTVLIFCAGTGNPCFTTDTAAALRAVECNSELLLKATKVDGVYSSDPVKDKGATKFKEISYEDFIQKQLKVLDTAAISICMEHRIPIRVYNVMDKGALLKLIDGESIGTIIRE